MASLTPKRASKLLLHMDDRLKVSSKMSMETIPAVPSATVSALHPPTAAKIKLWTLRRAVHSVCAYVAPRVHEIQVQLV